MARQPLAFGNWKMNHTQVAARRWCADLVKELGDRPLPDGIGLGVAPPFTSLRTVADAVGDRVTVAGQNVHWETSGAFTVELSAEMLAECGCTAVIIGHSERRHVFGESDERIARKVAAAREVGLVANLTISGAGVTPALAERMRVFGQVNLSVDGVGPRRDVFRPGRPVRSECLFRRRRRQRQCPQRSGLRGCGEQLTAGPRQRLTPASRAAGG